MNRNAYRFAHLLFGKSEMKNSIRQPGFDSVEAQTFRVTQHLLQSPGSVAWSLIRPGRFTGKSDQPSLRVETDLIALESGNFDTGIIVRSIFEPLDSRRIPGT